MGAQRKTISKKVKIDVNQKFSEVVEPASIDINNSGEVREYIKAMKNQQSFSQNLSNLGKVKTVLPEINEEMAIKGGNINNSAQ